MRSKWQVVAMSILEKARMEVLVSMPRTESFFFEDGIEWRSTYASEFDSVALFVALSVYRGGIVPERIRSMHESKNTN